MSKWLYHIVAFLVVAVWGSTFVFTKLLLLSGLSAAQIFTLRFIIAYLLLLAFSLTRRPFRLMADSLRDELLMFALGVMGGSLYFLTENSAMNYTTTTNTSLIVCLCPLFAALLISAFYKSERLHGVQIIGTVLAAVGVAVVVLNGHFVLHLSPRGDALAFAACLCWAVYSLLMIPAGRRYDTVFITRKVFFYGLLSMIPYFLLRPGLPPVEVVFRPSIMANLLFLGCVASMLCFVAWNWVLKRLGAMTATNYVYFNPVTTVLFAWLVLSEQITVYFLAGTLLILLGTYLADRKRPDAHIAPTENTELITEI
ncbi:MAG: DMT family transporter [Bacteroidaceae bacterium]|nr:DMT family transporter [Bacteroidaceae bacterium]